VRYWAVFDEENKGMIMKVSFLQILDELFCCLELRLSESTHHNFIFDI
jgi:hypothetical protein